MTVIHAFVFVDTRQCQGHRFEVLLGRARVENDHVITGLNLTGFLQAFDACRTDLNIKHLMVAMPQVIGNAATHLATGSEYRNCIVHRAISLAQ